MTVLLDANVLIGLLIDEHVHHEPAEAWFEASTDRFATCPITEGSLIRTLIRVGQPAGRARAVLTTFATHPRHEFWRDDLSYREIPLERVDGHRQVTDAYLVHLARSRRGRMLTFDRAMASAYPDVVDLLPT